jgi:NDP-sugar pyrophosphorylase family protein/aminoglycoside/choline kinase family phosphotransferase
VVKAPAKAFVLAAGFGTRLLPLTRETPKPLLPIWNVSNLERILAMLKSWGVREVLINVHHRADRLFEHVRARPSDGLRIALSFEPEILGTGGALRKADWFFAGDAPVWVLNADVVAEVKARPLLRAYHARRTIAVAWVHASRGPRTVDVRRGRITNFQSKQAGQPGTFTFCGLQLVNPKLVERGAEFLPREPVFGSIITAYQKAQAAGWAVAGVEVPGSYWADIGTPAQYLACHRELGGGGDFVAADASAVVHPKAQVSNSVVGARAVLGPRARVTNAVVAPDTRVNQPVSYLALPAPTALEPVELALLARYGWDPGCCTALPFGPRGSARTFTRVACGTRTALLVHYDPTRQENTWYVRHARFLRRLGLPVPRVLADDARGHASLFEDLGDASVEAEFARMNGDRRESVYRAVLEVMVRWHERGAVAARREALPLMPAFRPTLYAWERTYFAEHMLRKRCGLGEPVVAAIVGELAGVGRALNRAPRVLVHRDLQSSNVLLKSGRPWFIDFQGMRFGPAVYDVASLLCDPYVKMDSNLRARLVEHYARRCASPALVRRLFWFGAVQRLAQALGAFARLGSQPATRAFARHIPAALGVMDEALSRGVPCPRLQRWCKDQIRVVG